MSQINNLETELTEGKEELATAITAQGVSTSATDSLGDMATNIAAIGGGLTGKIEGTEIECMYLEDLVSGQFVNINLDSLSISNQNNIASANTEKIYKINDTSFLKIRSKYIDLVKLNPNNLELELVTKFYVSDSSPRDICVLNDTEFVLLNYDSVYKYEIKSDKIYSKGSVTLNITQCYYINYLYDNYFVILEYDSTNDVGNAYIYLIDFENNEFTQKAYERIVSTSTDSSFVSQKPWVDSNFNYYLFWSNAGTYVFPYLSKLSYDSSNNSISVRRSSLKDDTTDGWINSPKFLSYSNGILYYARKTTNSYSNSHYIYKYDSEGITRLENELAGYTLYPLRQNEEIKYLITQLTSDEDDFVLYEVNSDDFSLTKITEGNLGLISNIYSELFINTRGIVRTYVNQTYFTEQIDLFLKTAQKATTNSNVGVVLTTDETYSKHNVVIPNI